jgi:hypothetical protein
MPFAYVSTRSLGHTFLMITFLTMSGIALAEKPHIVMILADDFGELASLLAPATIPF